MITKHSEFAQGRARSAEWVVASPDRLAKLPPLIPTLGNPTLEPTMRGNAKTVLVIAFTLLLVALGVGCTGKSSSGVISKSGIDAEAQGEAEKYWNSLLTKCGSGTFGQDNRRAVDQIYEFRDVSITTKARKLADADKQNGLEWSGDANLESKTSRILTGDKWGPWREGSILLNSEKMEKANSQWKFGVAEDARAPLRTFECSKLP